MSKEIIFIHSSFRTSSTWLWKKFRDNDRAMAFLEPFHEGLATMGREEILSNGSSGWDSRHPATEAYFLEFLPLVVDGKKGVPTFNAKFSYEGFFPPFNLGEKLDESQIKYINSLRDLADNEGKTPVLACTRTLGKLRSLKDHYGGIHMFAYRNIYEQWFSYLSLHKAGNSYFIETVSYTIMHSNIDAIRILRERYCNSAEFFGFGNLQNALYAFFGLHIFMYGSVKRSSDVIIDTSLLSSDKNYVSRIQRQILKYTGLEINLDDARRAIHHSQMEFDTSEIDRVCSMVVDNTKDIDIGFVGMLKRDFLKDHSLITALRDVEAQ